ncbi:UDP-glycosyltransferase 89B2, partial [Linum perenne]
PIGISCRFCASDSADAKCFDDSKFCAIRMPNPSASEKLLMKEDPDRVIFRDCFLANLSSWGTVINTFARIEQPYLDHLKRESSHKRVWGVDLLLLPLPPPSGYGSGND